MRQRSSHKKNKSIEDGNKSKDIVKSEVASEEFHSCSDNGTSDAFNDTVSEISNTKVELVTGGLKRFGGTTHSNYSSSEIDSTSMADVDFENEEGISGQDYSQESDTEVENLTKANKKHPLSTKGGKKIIFMGNVKNQIKETFNEEDEA
eukprot:CAMPEP_0116888632 /NCGR_PEP_ID=MMETSP0463-20121206/23757_1 /TAXON_ID=181622 /ORGANISM="Strombidinopsis sp, Strain SopsisLIS2011" /LENGTH=148 /DNA_ID=CAMNT_0004553797 /DNA_START=2268 /DNA_END=2714 /DNA_ORIENTATION=-